MQRPRQIRIVSNPFHRISSEERTPLRGPGSTQVAVITIRNVKRHSGSPRKRCPLFRSFRRKTVQESTKGTARGRTPTTPTPKRLIAPPVREQDSLHAKPKLDEEGALDLRRRSRLAKGLKHRSDLSTRWFLAHSPLAAPEGTTAHGQV